MIPTTGSRNALVLRKPLPKACAGTSFERVRADSNHARPASRFAAYFPIFEKEIHTAPGPTHPALAVSKQMLSPDATI